MTIECRFLKKGDEIDPLNVDLENLSYMVRTYVDIDALIFNLGIDLSPILISTFSKKDDKLKLWINREGKVAIELDVHIRSIFNNNFIDIKNAREKIYDVIYGLDEKCQWINRLSAFVTKCDISL